MSRPPGRSSRSAAVERTAVDQGRRAAGVAGPRYDTTAESGAMETADESVHKQDEDELRRLAARLTTTLESITDGFFTLDREWRFTYLNKEAERLLEILHESGVDHLVVLHETAKVFVALGRPDADEYLMALDAAAERATRGDYFVTGKELAKRRRKDVRMNTEVRNVKE